MATKSEARRAAEVRIDGTVALDLDALRPDQFEIARRASECEAWTVVVSGGYSDPPTYTVAIFPASRRAAVASNGDSEWTDIEAERGPEAAREAVARYLAGEMCP